MFNALRGLCNWFMSSKPIKQHKECLLQAYTVLIAFELEHKDPLSQAASTAEHSDARQDGRFWFWWLWLWWWTGDDKHTDCVHGQRRGRGCCCSGGGGWQKDKKNVNIDIVYNLVFKHHSSLAECSFFNSCINLFMNQLTFGRPTVLLFSFLRTRYQEESVGRPTAEGPVQSVA